VGYAGGASAVYARGTALSWHGAYNILHDARRTTYNDIQRRHGACNICPWHAAYPAVSGAGAVQTVNGTLVLAEGNHMVVQGGVWYSRVGRGVATRTLFQKDLHRGSSVFAVRPARAMDWSEAIIVELHGQRLLTALRYCRHTRG
jgi:hypothetical protein